AMDVALDDSPAPPPAAGAGSATGPSGRIDARRAALNNPLATDEHDGGGAGGARAEAEAARAVALEALARARGARGAAQPAPAAAELRERELSGRVAGIGREPWPPPGAPAALAGQLAEIERALATGERPRALVMARAWHDKQPGDVLALIGLGDVLEANHEPAEAARIYGSIIDLYPSRADLRRFAGERLER